jgi:hypothetical protein
LTTVSRREGRKLADHRFVLGSIGDRELPYGALSIVSLAKTAISSKPLI